MEGVSEPQCMGSHFQRQILPRTVSDRIRVRPWFYKDLLGTVRRAAYPLRGRDQPRSWKGRWTCTCPGVWFTFFTVDDELELGGAETRFIAKNQFLPLYKADLTISSLSYVQHMLFLMHMLADTFCLPGAYESIRNAIVGPVEGVPHSYFDISAAEVASFGRVLIPALVEDGWLTQEQAEAMHVELLLG